MKKIMVLFLAVVLLSGCSSSDNEEAAHYNSSLAGLFPREVGLTAVYNGSGGYGQTLELTDVIDERTTLQIIVEGYLHDSNGNVSDTKSFDVTYTVDSEKLTENVVSHVNSSATTKTLNSIIPGQIILKLPLEIGNSWTGKFEFNNKEYSYTTIISKKETNDEGNTEYTTKTYVMGIPGYYDNMYTESRVYEEGHGLVSFSNSLIIYDYNNDEDTEGFGYNQVEFDGKIK